MRPRRLRVERLACLALAACATQGGPVARSLRPVPADAVPSGWARAHIDEATRELFAQLSTQGLDALRRRRIRGDDLVTFLDPSGRRRAEQSVAGMTPRASERRWSVLRRMQGDTVAGWCARGVRVHDPGGAEGFAQRVLTVDRLLVVTEGSDGLWGFWLEGLALDDDGWRWLPWVPWTDAVETPRGAHADIALWVCDLDRPVASRSGSPAR